MIITDADLERDTIGLVEEGDEGETSQEVTPEPDPTEGVEGVIEETEEQKQQKRFQYWQAEAVRAQTEKEKLQFAAPIARLLEQRQDVAQKLEEWMNTPPAPPKPELEKPAEPVAPVSYDDVAAYNDPDSESYKHRRALEKHRDEMLRYFEKRDELRERKVEQERTERQQAAALAAKKATFMATLQTKGLTQVEADDLVQTLGDPKNLTEDTLIQVYRTIKGTSKEMTAAQAKAAEMQRRQGRHGAPIPAAIGGGEGGTTEMTEEQAFNAAFLKAGAKRNK